MRIKLLNTLLLLILLAGSISAQHSSIILQKRSNGDRLKELKISVSQGFMVETCDSSYMVHKLIEINDSVLIGTTVDTMVIDMKKIETIQVWPAGIGTAGLGLMFIPVIGGIATPINWILKGSEEGLLTLCVTVGITAVFVGVHFLLVEIQKKKMRKWKIIGCKPFDAELFSEELNRNYD